jgi:hypothetical protein
MKKVKGSFAVYKNKKGELVCKIKECAKILGSNWGNIPYHIGDLRAHEISLLARDYLRLRALCHKRLGTRK